MSRRSRRLILATLAVAVVVVAAALRASWNLLIKRRSDTLATGATGKHQNPIPRGCHMAANSTGIRLHPGRWLPSVELAVLAGTALAGPAIVFVGMRTEERRDGHYGG